MYTSLNEIVEGVNLKPGLKEYVEGNVLTQYDTNNIGGHDKYHIIDVSARSFELMRSFNLDLDPNMVFVIAAYHDIGYKEDKDKHEEISARKFLEDEEMKKFFTDEERQIMAEAIVDHRASLEYEARSVYGKLVSSADREVSVQNMLKRSFLYQTDKHANENPTTLQVIDYSFKKLSSKFGKDGYAKMYYPDEKYKNYLTEMQALLENKENFVRRELEIAGNIKNPGRNENAGQDR